MVVDIGLGVGGFDHAAWNARLSGCVEALLVAYDAEARALARLTLDEYDAALAAHLARVERMDNVIPLRSFSIHEAIDQIAPT